MSHKADLTLATVAELSDGQAGAIINAALAAAIRDTEDRGDDKKPRKVTIECELRKVGASGVTVNVKAKTTLPPYSTDPTIGEIILDGRNAKVRFSPAAAHNPDQPALPGAGRSD